MTTEELQTTSSETQPQQQDAPERLFAKACHPERPNQNCSWSVSKERVEGSVEYVRSDLPRTKSESTVPTKSVIDLINNWIAQLRHSGVSYSVIEGTEKLVEEVGKLSGEAGWQPIETAPRGRKLIVGYFNPLGKWRSVMGCYYLEGTLESDTDESGFAPEGWYEETEAYEYLMPMDQEPTHFQFLSDPPAVRHSTTQEGS